MGIGGLNPLKVCRTVTLCFDSLKAFYLVYLYQLWHIDYLVQGMYFIYDNLHKLNKATARLESSVTVLFCNM